MSTSTWLSALGVLLASLTAAGCGASSVSGSATDPSPEVRRETSDPTDLPADPADLPLVTLDELPLRFPHAPPPQSEGAADDVSAPDAQPPGLIDTLRGTVDASPIFEETGAQDSLLESLDAAQEQLNRVKRDNRHALREANRQVRVGGSRASPHLLLITISDIAYADLGSYGGPAGTPHLDAFAAEGMRFTDYYASSTDVQAARWSLMTGLNVGHAPTANELDERFPLPTEQRTLADVLWQSGYSTAFVGVWRDGSLPLDHGCDEWTGLQAPGTQLDPFPEFLYVDATRARLLPNADGKDELAVIDFLVDEAIASLVRRSAGNRHCFLHLALSPHLLPEPDAAGMLVDAAASRMRGLDAHLGRLLSQLEASELAESTCVMIAGEATPPELLVEQAASARSGVFRSSPDGLSDGNLRVPLLVRWPGQVPAGAVSDHVCAAWDLLPTLAELAAAQRKPSRLDGVSFAPELRGKSQQEHALLYWETREGGLGQAVRKGRWKGVRSPGSSTLALYDLLADPSEQHDLASDHPEIVRQFIKPSR